MLEEIMHERNCWGTGEGDEVRTRVPILQTQENFLQFLLNIYIHSNHYTK